MINVSNLQSSQVPFSNTTSRYLEAAKEASSRLLTKMSLPTNLDPGRHPRLNISNAKIQLISLTRPVVQTKRNKNNPPSFQGHSIRSSTSWRRLPSLHLFWPLGNLQRRQVSEASLTSQVLHTLEFSASTPLVLALCNVEKVLISRGLT